jgi:hypothetical protein
LGKGNVSVFAEEWGVDNCEEGLKENLKATFDINDQQCKVITTTEVDIGIFFQLEGNDVRVSLRNFGNYVKFNKECYHKGYKSSKMNTYLTAQKFAAPAAGQKWHRMKSINITERYEKKQVVGEQLLVLSSIRNELELNWETTYMNAKYNPGKWFQGKVVNKKRPEK